MLNRSIHSLIMGDLNCVTIVRIQHLECMPITHPPEASIARMLFYQNRQHKLGDKSSRPATTGANCAAPETHFVASNALPGSPVKRQINFGVAIDNWVRRHRGSGPIVFSSADTGQSDRGASFRGTKYSPKEGQTQPYSFRTSWLATTCATCVGYE